MPSFPMFGDPLTDGQVSLRFAAERDIPEILIAYQDDPQLHERLDEPRPPSGAELGRIAEQADAQRRSGTRVVLTILEPGVDDCRGQITIDNVDWDRGIAELGIWLAPQFRGRGMAVRARRLATDWLRGSCGLELVQRSGASKPTS